MFQRGDWFAAVTLNQQCGEVPLWGDRRLMVDKRTA